MALEGLLDVLRQHPLYEGLLERLRSVDEGEVPEHSPPPGARPCIIAALARHLRRPVLVIVPRAEDARLMYDQLLTYLGEEALLYLMPEPEALPYERLLPDAATANQRLRALSDLAGSEGPIVVASTAAAVRVAPDPQTFNGARLTLHVGQEMSPDELLQRWVVLGYRAGDGVEIPGTFARRGGILDVFPPDSPLPARLEFWGDRIDSIRLFEPFTQRSVQRVESIEIGPGQEVLPLLADEEEVWRSVTGLDFSRCRSELRDRIEEELSRIFSAHDVPEIAFYAGLFNRHTLLDHLPARGLLILERPGEMEGEAQEIELRAEGLRRARESRGELPRGFPSSQLAWRDLERAITTRRHLRLGGWATSDQGLGFAVVPSFQGRVDEFVARAGEMLKQGARVVVVSRHARRLEELLGERGVPARLSEGLEQAPTGGRITLVAGSLRQGWALALRDGHTSLFTDGEVFGTVKERRPQRKASIPQAPFASDLTPGSYVVHVDHGVARFSGTIKMGREDGQREYLVLEYAEGDRLYVPTDHLDRVSPYVAASDRPPTLTRLGTAEWARAKERAKGSAREMAQELLRLYATRATAEGHGFSPDSPWQGELEDSFPYEETSDQRRTIREVKRDMEMATPMDRLVCGDVGYGKTEVALRASFKAVMDGYQVAFLVPTTVLAQQHYATFGERLRPFPVRLEVLSRFRSDREQREVVEGLRNGQVDIVIGTHRLLQKDVTFKNLGLVMVDEEQRFGVAHKERLKSMRKEVDVVTLSATPIPRTLYMSLSGLRDMSTMDTPPEERLAIRTYVGEYGEEMVREAILRELERGGQVFFLHNRVQTIQRVAGEVQRLAPQVQLAVAHGRMPADELERVMYSFSRGEVDVLVCTTIIESGLDIPNANTLIIDRADMLGLSQLYQLRGRVGRAAHRAHAYLFVPRHRRITEAARKRLHAILEASELGAGFRIAMRDLEIRGAGNLLGAEQSGHIHAVGFDLYSQLLQQAIAEIKAQEAGGPVGETPQVETRVDLGLAAYIPDDYVEHLPTRLAVYQRLARVEERSQVKELEEELRDRFGPLPQPVTALLYVVEVKALAQVADVESVVRSQGQVVLALGTPVNGARLALEKVLDPHAQVGYQQVRLSMRAMGRTWRDELLRSLERIIAFRERVQNLAAATSPPAPKGK